MARANSKPKASNEGEAALPPHVPEQVAVDPPAPATESSSADASESSAPADQRLPENLEQVDAASTQQQLDNNDAAPGASDAAPPPPTPPEPEAVPLFAVTMVNLAGKYYSPGMQLEEAQLEKAGYEAVLQLYEAGCIREG